MRWLLLSLLLTGCATAAQIAENDDRVCQSYGAKPGTDGYVNCRVAREHERQETARSIADTKPSYRPTCDAMGACW